MSIVTCRPIGRLGNLMFQLAACIGYAKKYNMQWAVGPDLFENPNFLKWFPHLPTTAVFPAERYVCHEPAKFNYEPIPHFPHGVTLLGFFQSMKYFDNAIEEVKEAFKLKHIQGCEDYVSIHVRRGDFVKYADHFPPVNAEYLYEAMGRIIDELPTTRKFLFVSDDISWCREFAAKGYEYICDENRITDFKTEFSENRDPYEDLCLMASCGHHITANSTFSWWGAFLGHNPDRKIICPHHLQWLGPKNGVVTEAMRLGIEPCKDLVPDGWIEIMI